VWWNQTQNAKIQLHDETLEVDERVYGLELDRGEDGVVAWDVTIVTDSIECWGTNGVVNFPTDLAYTSWDPIAFFFDVTFDTISSTQSLLRDSWTEFRIRSDWDDIDFILNSFSTVDRVWVNNVLIAWERIVIWCIYNWTTLAIYINWVIQVSGTPTWSYSTFSIPSLCFASTEQFNGKIHSFRSYSNGDTLTPSQIRDICNWLYVTEWLTVSYTWKNFSGTAWTPTSIHNILPIEWLYDWQVITDFTQDWINYTVEWTIPTAYQTGVPYTQVAFISTGYDITTLTLAQDTVTWEAYFVDSSWWEHRVDYGSKHWIGDMWTVVGRVTDITNSTLTTDADYEVWDVLTFTSNDTVVVWLDYTLQSNTYRTSSDQISALPASHSFWFYALQLCIGLKQQLANALQDVKEINEKYRTLEERVLVLETP
jgi:hypothetical protein